MPDIRSSSSHATSPPLHPPTRALSLTPLPQNDGSRIAVVQPWRGRLFKPCHYITHFSVTLPTFRLHYPLFRYTSHFSITLPTLQLLLRCPVTSPDRSVSRASLRHNKGAPGPPPHPAPPFPATVRGALSGKSKAAHPNPDTRHQHPPPNHRPSPPPPRAGPR